MELKAEKRDKFGKSLASLREQGWIPAELYGHGVPNVHLMVQAKDFDKVHKSGSGTALLSLLVEGEKRNALIHDIQEDYLSGRPVHIDFYQVRMDEKTTGHIPIEFIGESPAVKEGGILNRTMLEIEIEALPGDLPSKFEVDLGEIKELNQSIYVKDLRVPKGVEILVEPDTVIATVTPPMKEEEIAPAPAADVSEVKVETEEKKAEREKEAAAEGEPA